MTTKTKTGSILAQLAQEYLTHTRAPRNGCTLWEEFRDTDAGKIPEPSAGLGGIVIGTPPAPGYLAEQLIIRDLQNWIEDFSIRNGYNDSQEFLSAIGELAKNEGLVHSENMDKPDAIVGSGLVLRIVLNVMSRSTMGCTPSTPKTEEVDRYLAAWDSVLIERFRENLEGTLLDSSLVKDEGENQGGVRL